MNSKILILTLALGMAATACDSSPSPAKQKSGQSGPEWTLTFKNTCADGSKETCLGFYGFSVDASGKYTVGAELAGTPARVKTLDADEFAAVQKLADPFVAALKTGSRAAEACISRDAPILVPSDEQTVTLTQQGNTAVISHDTGEKSCTSLLDADQSHALAAQLLALAQAHYPTPYPDPCLAQIDAFEAKYADFQSCSQATDCAYIGQDYSVIPYDSSQVVFEEDYSKLAPLVVGNASKITAAKAAITQAHEDLVTSCGDSYWRNPVPSAFRQFYSNAGNPICEQGVCKVNPSVFSTRLH